MATTTCNHQWKATTSFRTSTGIVKNLYCPKCKGKTQITKALPKKKKGK